MATREQMKTYAVRACVDLSVLALVLLLVLMGLYAYQGHQAFLVIQQTIEQQNARMRAQQPQQGPSAPSQTTK